MINIEEKETKHLMFTGFPGNKRATFKAHGLEFQPFTVYENVSEEVLKWAGHQRYFIVGNFPRTKNKVEFPEKIVDASKNKMPEM